MTKKRLFLGLLFAAVLVSFIVMPSLQAFNKAGNDEVRFTQDDSVRSMQVKIQKMRQEIAKNGDTFEVGMNEAMLTPLDQLCTLNPEMKPADDFLYESNEQELVSDVMALPTSYYGYYTSIKNQGNCGSCWAFSMTAEVETTARRLTGTTYNFSEEYVLDCNTSGYSCSGGWFNFNMFMSPYGARLESCYPYVGVKGTCSTACSYVYRITNWAYVGTSSSVPTSTAIKTAIYNYGGVSAAVYANSYLQAYTSGCFSYNSTGTVNHAIQLVGWNDTTCTTGAWYLKNSWGTSWGISGFMWIKYGVQKVGYAACYSY